MAREWCPTEQYPASYGPVSKAFDVILRPFKVILRPFSGLSQTFLRPFSDLHSDLSQAAALEKELEKA